MDVKNELAKKAENTAKVKLTKNMPIADMIKALEPEIFEKFLKIMMELDFEIKPGKNLTIKGKNQKRFIRFKSLGDGYSESDIRKIIEGEACLEEILEECEAPLN